MQTFRTLPDARVTVLDQNNNILFPTKSAFNIDSALLNLPFDHTHLFQFLMLIF